MSDLIELGMRRADGLLFEQSVIFDRLQSVSAVSTSTCEVWLQFFGSLNLLRSALFAGATREAAHF
jgi:hypothetical protein